MALAFLRADNSSQYQLSSQTGARSARHSLRPQTRCAPKLPPYLTGLDLKDLVGFQQIIYSHPNSLLQLQYDTYSPESGYLLCLIDNITGWNSLKHG